MKVTPELRKTVIRLNMPGTKSYRKIAKEVGLSSESVRQIILERRNIMDAAKTGKIIPAKVYKRGPYKPRAAKTNDVVIKTPPIVEKENVVTPTINKVKLVKEVIEPSKSSYNLTLNYNGLNIHLNKDTITDIYISNGKIRVQEK